MLDETILQILELLHMADPGGGEGESVDGGQGHGAHGGEAPGVVGWVQSQMAKAEVLLEYYLS